MDVGSEARSGSSTRTARRAWGDSARADELLGDALLGVPGIVVLHDRRMPGTRAKIDHVVIGRGGVFVVDAKRYAGRIGIHNKGGLFRSDNRLYVGRRDCSALADGVAWQADAVADALRATGLEGLPSVTSVLCFVDGEWPMLNPPSSFRGVRLESERSLKKLVEQGQAVDPQTIKRVTRALATALPAK
jgi:Nuclease-related domain